MCPQYQQDVYISYSEADQAWVDDELIPRFDEAHVTYIDHQRFILGRPKLAEIERAVERSRRTLLVLSPDYLNETWRKFDSFLVLSYGLDNNCWLAVPVIKSPCEVPRPLSALVSVDLSDSASASADAAWDHLLETLASPVEITSGEDHADLNRAGPPGRGRGQPAIHLGLAALMKLMGRPEVCKAVARYRENFKRARDQIKILADFKDLHEALHTLQVGCFAVIHNSLKTFPDDEDTCNSLLAYEFSLQTIVTDVEGIIRSPTFAGYQNNWIRNLSEASSQLQQANRSREVKLLKNSVWNLRTVLGEQPTRINDKLVEAARDLRLTTLVFDMKVVRQQMEEVGIEVNDLRSFADSIDNLADLYHKLKSLISDHDRWQEIDIIQRRIKNNLSADDISELENSWPLLRDLTNSIYELRAESWAVSLKTSAQALDSAIAVQDSNAARRYFQGFYSQGSDRFARVDKALKKLCDDLRGVGDLLSSILEMLQ